MALIIAWSFVVMPQQAQAFEFAMGPKVDLGVGFFLGEDWWDRIDARDNMNWVSFDCSGGLMTDMTFWRGRVFAIGMQAEFLYKLTGGGDYEDSDNYYTEMTHGVSIPVYIKPRFVIGKVDLYFLLGPSIFIPLADMESKTKTPSGTSTSDIKIDADVMVGLGVGMGVDINIGPGKLELGVCLTPYFMDYWDNYEQRQNSFTFTIGYAFNLVKTR